MVVPVHGSEYDMDSSLFLSLFFFFQVDGIRPLLRGRHFFFSPSCQDSESRMTLNQTVAIPIPKPWSPALGLVTSMRGTSCCRLDGCYREIFRDCKSFLNLRW